MASLENETLFVRPLESRAGIAHVRATLAKHIVLVALTLATGFLSRFITRGNHVCPFRDYTPLPILDGHGELILLVEEILLGP